MDVHKITHVKSSNGTREERIFIMTELELYGKVFKTEVSLTDRTAMTYPMLVGRKYLEDRFLVDVSLLYQAPKK
jgi:hypothetical protein